MILLNRAVWEQAIDVRVWYRAMLLILSGPTADLRFNVDKTFISCSSVNWREEISGPQVLVAVGYLIIWWLRSCNTGEIIIEHWGLNFIISDIRSPCSKVISSTVLHALNTFLEACHQSWFEEPVASLSAKASRYFSLVSRISTLTLSSGTSRRVMVLNPNFVTEWFAWSSG